MSSGGLVPADEVLCPPSGVDGGVDELGASIGFAQAHRRFPSVFIGKSLSESAALIIRGTPPEHAPRQERRKGQHGPLCAADEAKHSRHSGVGDGRLRLKRSAHLPLMSIRNAGHVQEDSTTGEDGASNARQTPEVDPQGVARHFASPCRDWCEEPHLPSPGFSSPLPDLGPSGRGRKRRTSSFSEERYGTER